MHTTMLDHLRWWALALLCAAQFIVILDTSIIGVALPALQTDFGFTAEGLSWIFNAYVIAFGGLLLLGGKLGDVFGARRMFMLGAAASSLSNPDQRENGGDSRDDGGSLRAALSHPKPEHHHSSP